MNLGEFIKAVPEVLKTIQPHHDDAGIVIHDVTHIAEIGKEMQKIAMAFVELFPDSEFDFKVRVTDSINNAFVGMDIIVDDLSYVGDMQKLTLLMNGICRISHDISIFPRTDDKLSIGIGFGNYSLVM